ncbi:hypothetical protein HK104_000315, partial [Borealophlyctis nickersoniae]
MPFAFTTKYQGSPNVSFTNFPTHLLTNITSLQIHRTKYLDNRTIKDIANTCGSRLRNLALIDALYMTDPTLQYLLSHASKLEVLSLKGCIWVSDTTLSIIAHSPCISRLQTLDLTGAKGLTDAGMHAFETSP